MIKFLYTEFNQIVKQLSRHLDKNIVYVQMFSLLQFVREKTNTNTFIWLLASLLIYVIIHLHITICTDNLLQNESYLEKSIYFDT